jgi:hypothetical protein
LIQQQQEQNAAVLRAAYAINELNDYQRILIERLRNELTQTQQHIGGQIQQQLDHLQGQAEHLQLRISNIEKGMQEGSRQQLIHVHQLAQQIRDFSVQRRRRLTDAHCCNCSELECCRYCP